MFKNFRPVKVNESTITRDSQGVIIKGQIVRAADEEIPGFSLESMI
jgi:hypothetical protein